MTLSRQFYCHIGEGSLVATELTIAELAAHTGISVRTIWFYAGMVIDRARQTLEGSQ